MDALEDVLESALGLENGMMMKLAIPKRRNIFKATWEDSLGLYYAPVINYFYLHRFKIAVKLMRNGKYPAMLDLGFGCGIFLKELSRHAEKLSGIDVHDGIDKVREMARREGFSAELKKGSILSIPYGSALFDCVVSMSVLEHIPQLESAMSEIKRVANENADIILGFPVKNILMNSFFRLLGYDHDEIHPCGHLEILQAIERNLDLVRLIKFPQWAALNHCLYLVAKCRKGKKQD